MASIPSLLSSRTLQLFGIISSFAFASAQNCSDVCSPKYSSNPTVVSSCTSLCDGQPTLFNVNYPYLLGPLPMKPYPELTGAPVDELNAAFSNRNNRLYARVNSERDKIQFYLDMVDNPEPYFPYFAMHLHQGNLIPEEIGGHILVHIAGSGDLVGCAGVSRVRKAKNRLTICSSECTEGNHKLSNCVNPKRHFLSIRRCPLCNQKLAGAYFCKGGCQGDSRIKGYTIKDRRGRSKVEAVAPSRFCDLKNPDKPNNPGQRKWIQGLHSHEFSGNETDGEEYSKYSIARPENFDLWCGEALPFLVDDVFKAGTASYVALHVNFNATGAPALLYGDIFTAVSTTNEGPQSCTLFGNPSLPCSGGVPGLLKGLDEP